jgi:hypothetical protein
MVLFVPDPFVKLVQSVSLLSTLRFAQPTANHAANIAQY